MLGSVFGGFPTRDSLPRPLFRLKQNFLHFQHLVVITSTKYFPSGPPTQSISTYFFSAGTCGELHV